MTVTHARRRERLAALLPACEADAILVTGGVNVRYLTGLDSSNAALLVRADARAALATDSRYAETARRVCPDVEVIEDRDVTGVLATAVLDGSPPGRLAVEAHRMTADVYFTLGGTCCGCPAWWSRCAGSRTRRRSACCAPRAS